MILARLLPEHANELANFPPDARAEQLLVVLGALDALVRAAALEVAIGCPREARRLLWEAREYTLAGIVPDDPRECPP